MTYGEVMRPGHAGVTSQITPPPLTGLYPGIVWTIP